MAIYLCGDTHGTLDLDKVLNYFSDDSLVEECSKADYLIILGDVAIIWDDGPHDREIRNLLQALPVTVLWIDGNHENHDLIDSLPIEEWHGGRVHFIEADIIHLMRGQIFEIEGHTFFTFGGGNSIDKAHRTEGINWRRREMPSDEEYEEGLRNLDLAGNKVYYVLTHTCPTEIAHQLVVSLFDGEEKLQEYLQHVAEEIEFKEWYFGHWHMDEDIDNFHGLFEEIVRIV